MKVLGISCSPRKTGNTNILLQQALKGAAEREAEIELFDIIDKKIEPCDHCRACLKTPKCHIQDDMQDLLCKMKEADAIILGTPVYFLSVTAQAKAIMDRTYCFVQHGVLSNKVGGGVIVASSMGHTSAWDVLHNFFWLHHMRTSDVVLGFARNPGDVVKDKHAMLAATELGRMVVSLCKSGFYYPTEHNVTLYRYVAKKYGVDQCPAMGRFGGPHPDAP